MRLARRHLLTLGMAAPLVGLWAAPCAAQASLGQTLALPADLDAVILRWTSSGGMLPTLDADALLIQASGAYSARARPGERRRRSGRLEAQALQALLIWVIEHQGFAQLSGEAMLAEIQGIGARSGRLFRVMDGGEMAFELDLPDLQHRVSFAALDAAFSRFPEVDGLRRLHAIKQLLLSLADSAR